MKPLSSGLVQAVRTDGKACVAESRIVSVAVFRGVEGTRGGKRKRGDDGNAARKLHPACLPRERTLFASPSHDSTR